MASEIDNGHPSRIIVRDGELKNPEELSNTDLLYTESKTEVTINRITAKANPRTFERVPAGAKFNLEMVLNILMEITRMNSETPSRCNKTARR